MKLISVVFIVGSFSLSVSSELPSAPERHSNAKLPIAYPVAPADRSRRAVQLDICVRVDMRAIDSVDKDGRPPLAVAILHRQPETIRRLIAQRTDINAVDNNGDTALVYAINQNDIDSAELLIRSGARIDQKIYIKSACAELRMFRKIADNCPKSHSSAVDKDGYTALMCATRGDKVEIVDAIIRYGGNVNQLNRDLWTALMVAARYGSSACAKRLVDAGTDVHIVSSVGATALWLAVRNGHRDVVDILLKSKNTFSQGGLNSALSLAREHHYDRIAELLLAAGAQRQHCCAIM